MNKGHEVMNTRINLGKATEKINYLLIQQKGVDSNRVHCYKRRVGISE